ncbi:MAG: hypothetical protein MK209_02225 [Planctomycetes bacterium]|nr:hypothetical protein [Planctomycetota bacterium]
MKPAPTARRRLAETGLWLAAAAVGLFVLLPAVVELIDARRMEGESRVRAEGAGEVMQDELQKTKKTVNDLEQAEKLGQKAGLERNKTQSDE